VLVQRVLFPFLVPLFFRRSLHDNLVAAATVRSRHSLSLCLQQVGLLVSLAKSYGSVRTGVLRNGKGLAPAPARLGRHGGTV
jgi:ABC-type transport system involved in cytochrome bd biosynthesis fused ATPase/permease subunit